MLKIRQLVALSNLVVRSQTMSADKFQDWFYKTEAR